MMVMSLFIGFRPQSGAFLDMMNYRQFYYVFTYGQPFQFSLSNENFLNEGILSYLGSIKAPIGIYFIMMSFFYFGFLFIACRKFFPKDNLYAYIIYLGAFSTFSYGTNGLKAGVAASIFLCALAYRNNKIAAFLFLYLSYGFHHSMMFPIAAYIACLFYKNTRTYFYFWVICILIAALHITAFQELFGSMSDDTGAEYLSTSESGYRAGFRPDFIFYSSFPVFAGYYAIFKHGYRSKFYSFLFNVYLLTNGIWMLCMYASFTNRIAYLSWFMLPIVLIYPFFDKAFVPGQYRKLNYVAGWHLAFTIAMQVVYYGLLK
jgi:hypothetical protein